MRVPGFLAAAVIVLSSNGQDAPMPVRLPLSVGDSSRLIQGNNGPYGHEGHAAYAFDFIMRIGTPVVAARSGTVVAIEERFRDATRKAGEENFVIVQHDDSSFARYYHLTTDGALVAVGQSVAAGDTIARSGDSGSSAGPHLHFDVTRGCYRWGCQTVRLAFTNASPDSLVAGRFYLAKPMR